MTTPRASFVPIIVVTLILAALYVPLMLLANVPAAQRSLESGAI